MRRAAITLILWLLAASAFAQSGPTLFPRITVHLSNFAFTPDHIVLPINRPVQLVLVNDSNHGHDFSAPSLFATSAFPRSAPPTRGRIELDPKQTTSIVFIPRIPGRYPFRCTHFLHSFFGMHGSVTVEPETG
jgi:uncharacterized cupredoxin-like copper-binding protein